jgi:YegS/Rv2252/BmrU family lipid kinase
MVRLAMGVPLLVANPLSGGGRAGRGLDAIRGIIERRLGAVDVALTTRPGHAIDLAREGVRDGRDLIVALGGDGTLHEVANGILDAGGGAAVGYVGKGTGGDFRRTLGIEHRLDAYVDAIASGRERLVDVGKLRYRAPNGETETRWFVNIVSAGMGGLVDRYVSETTKALGGTVAYFLASLRALAVCQRGRLRCMVELAGQRAAREESAYMIAVCNGRYFGSGMHVAPMASLDDGRFEVVAMDAPGKLAFAGSSHRIYGGGHIGSDGTRHFGCDRMTIDLENESARDVFLLDVDGELLGGLPLHVELVPKALRLRV